MCGGGGAPQDNSHIVAQIEADAAAARREEERLQREQDRVDFDNNLASAYSAAINSANNYFSSQGLDPSQYEAAITSSAGDARARVPILDSSPGTYFDGLGAQIFDQLQTGQRNQDLRLIDSFAGQGFARDRIADTADDAILSQLLEDAYSESRGYYDNLRERGVITDSAYSRAIRDLDDQRGGAGLELADIGSAVLETGRGSLRDIASDARRGASTALLGSNFDPLGFESQINDATQEFFAGLSDRIGQATPTDLFNTDNLASLVGRSSGAQNTLFDPRALAGLNIGEEEEDEEDENNNVFA